MQKQGKERINVIFPNDVLRELRQLVPPKRRSQLIVQATQEKLSLLRQQIAVKKAAGAWKDGEHPELQTDEDFALWIAQIRGPWRVRQELFGEQKVKDVSP